VEESWGLGLTWVQLAALTVTRLRFDWRLEFRPRAFVDGSLGLRIVVEGEKVLDWLVRREAAERVLMVAVGVVLAGWVEK